jgi:hypothetical protein
MHTSPGDTGLIGSKVAINHSAIRHYRRPPWDHFQTHRNLHRTIRAVALNRHHPIVVDSRSARPRIHCHNGQPAVLVRAHAFARGRDTLHIQRAHSGIRQRDRRQERIRRRRPAFRQAQLDLGSGRHRNRLRGEAWALP